MEIMNFIKDYWAIIIIIAGVFGIEFSKPIKIKPLSLVFLPIRYVLGIEVLNKRVDELYKTNDFNHSIDIKSKITALKALHNERYLYEDEWNRFFEQAKRYKFLLEKYPKEMNGHMTKMLEFMEDEYFKGNISIDKRTRK